MTKQKRLLASCTIFALLSNSCAHVEERLIDTGPRTMGCVVDVKAGGYQCATLDQDPFFLNFKDAGPMVCVSPKDLEATLKSCKNSQILSVNQCYLSEDRPSCFDPKGTSVPSELPKLDNYYCMPSKDWGRIYERCDPRF